MVKVLEEARDCVQHWKVKSSEIWICFVLVLWSICIEIGPFVKAPGKEVTKCGNLGGKKCPQINGQCAVHLKIGTKQKAHEVSAERVKREACVGHTSVTKSHKYFLSSIFFTYFLITDVTCPVRTDSQLQIRQKRRKQKSHRLFPSSGISQTSAPDSRCPQTDVQSSCAQNIEQA